MARRTTKKPAAAKAKPAPSGAGQGVEGAKVKHTVRRVRSHGEEFTIDDDYAPIAQAHGVEIDDDGKWLDAIEWQLIDGTVEGEPTRELVGTPKPKAA